MFQPKTPAELQVNAVGESWIIDRLIPTQSCCLVAGDPKTRKSWFAAELIVAIATGSKAFGMYEVSQRGPVLMIQAEDKESIIRDRLDEIAKTRGATAESLRDVTIIAGGEPFHLDNDEHFAWLRSHIELKRHKLVILDPLVRLMPNTAESSTSQMGKILTKLRELQKSYGVSIMLVHHNSKRHSTNPADNIRGSGDLRSWYDAAYFLTKPVGHITQVAFEFKASGDAPDFFFELKTAGGGLAPMGLMSLPDIRKESA